MHRLWALFIIMAGYGQTVGAEPNTPQLRWLVAASHDSAPRRPTLQYAHLDASRMHAELTQSAGFRGEVHHSPTLAQLEAQLAKAQAQLQAFDGYSVLFVYFSGHGTSTDLLLGSDRLPRDRLFEMLATIPADLKIVMLDACREVTSKGAGGRLQSWVGEPAREPPKGTVVLYPAAQGELAFEADRYQGSQFTYAFLSAIRGAARFRAGQAITLGAVIEYARGYTDEKSRNTPMWQRPVIDNQVYGEALVLVPETEPGKHVEVNDHQQARLYGPDGSRFADVEAGGGSRFFPKGRAVVRYQAARPVPRHWQIAFEHAPALATSGSEFIGGLSQWWGRGRLLFGGQLGMRWVPTQMISATQINENAMEFNLLPGIRWRALSGNRLFVAASGRFGPGLRTHARASTSTQVRRTWFWTARARADLHAGVRMGAFELGVQAGAGLAVHPHQARVTTTTVPAWGLSLGWNP